jgi:hypothetical protein
MAELVETPAPREKSAIMPRMQRASLVLAAALVSATAPAQTTDPLASWNDGKEALDEALQRDWTVVDMKKDWKRIYPFEK